MIDIKFEDCHKSKDNDFDKYDDNNIPQVDLPKDIIPDEVRRKDGPGGEGGE